MMRAWPASVTAIARRALVSSVGCPPPVDLGAGVDLFDREIAEPKQHVMHAVDGPCTSIRLLIVQVLELGLDIGNRIRVQQIAQLDLAEQLAQLRLIDRQCLGAAFGERGIAVVEVVGDVAKQQRRGKRRRHGRVHGRHPDLAPFHPAERFDQRRHVEDVAQTLAVRLEDDRKGPEARRDGEQVGRAFPQLPERAAAARPALGQEQRAARGLAELGREHRRSPELAQHQRLDLVGRRHHQPHIRRLVGLGESHHEPVVGPHRLDVQPRFRAGALDDGHRPWGVDAAAERREHADAPVAQLVAAALDEDRAVVGHDAGRRDLIGEIAQEILGRLRVEIVVPDEPLHRGRRRHGDERAHELADGASELQRPADRIGLPERHLAGLSRRR